MKKITLKEFWDSKDRLAIHCNTEEKAIKLCKAFDKMGKRWVDVESYIDENEYKVYKSNTCYSNNGGYCSYVYLKIKGFKIYEFEDILLDDEDTSKDVGIEGIEVFKVIQKGNQIIFKSKRKETIATCSPQDKFNMYTGVKLALDRYFNKEVQEDKETPKKTRDTNFKVGDKVRIRAWGDMINEYGLNEYGSISCMYSFTKRMKHLCGELAIIKDLDGEGVELDFINKKEYIDYWGYSTDMIEKVEE